MASVNPNLKPMAAGREVRDYKHASRTFVDNNYELQPRYGNLFHVVFEFTAEAVTLFNSVEQLEIPILVKSCDLPGYNIEVTTHNQYNRKVHSQHSIGYDPVNIRFHDDAKELIRNMWHKYYIFYNADPTYDLDSNSYTPYDKYSNRVQQQWGLQRGNKRFFKSIKIYSMHNHKFAEYTLINPIIQSFSHDSHAYESNNLMEHRMSVLYETVKYATGFVNNVNPRGFGDIHYDTQVSDLSTGNPQNEVFINGATQDVTGQQSKDLFQGNLIGVIKDAEVIYDQARLTGDNIISDTLGIFANNLLTGKRPTENILVPVTGIVESAANKFSGGLVEGIARTIEGINIGGGNSSTVITSQGNSIANTTYSRTPTNVSYDAGFAFKYPAGNGSIANAPKISDTINAPKQVKLLNSRRST